MRFLHALNLRLVLLRFQVDDGRQLEHSLSRWNALRDGRGSASLERAGCGDQDLGLGYPTYLCVDVVVVAYSGNGESR